MTTIPLCPDDSPTERTLFSWRHFSGVLRDTTLPNGVETTTFTLEHPGAVVILPIAATGSILFLSQYRPAIGTTILELPAGTLEKGEDPATCAAREVIEETGFAARELLPLGQLLPAPGFCNEVQWCFVARDLTPASAAADEDEVIEVVEVHVAELPALIASGRLYDGKSLGVLMKGVVAGVLTI